MLFYIQNPKTGMVLDVKGATGPDVMMHPFHGDSNQLWEYRNRMIYSKLNE